jgi:hypothetical protein
MIVSEWKEIRVDFCESRNVLFLNLGAAGLRVSTLENLPFCTLQISVLQDLVILQLKS